MNSKLLISGHKVARVSLGFSALALALLLSGCPQKGADTAQTGADTSSSSSMVQPPKAGLEKDFAFTGADGKEHMLSDYLGKPLVLNFWATWCPPCVGEMPHFQEVYASRQGQFNLVSVAVASSEDPKAFAASNGYTWTFGQVKDDTAPMMYGVQGIPATFFYDKSGKLVDQMVGGMSKEDFEQRLAKIL
ncbi:TlpA family protein disulfide reductase [bacterium]|nr:TlpA family protein disulfide reductase [bacterium]